MELKIFVIFFLSLMFKNFRACLKLYSERNLIDSGMQKLKISVVSVGFEISVLKSDYKAIFR